MYSGTPIGHLPEQVILHELKVRVPPEILMHDDPEMNEGYLVQLMGDWFLSPNKPTEKDRPLYLLTMQLCDDPFEQIVAA